MADTSCDEYRSDDSPAVGMRAPDFELISETGSKWRLSDHDGNVRVLLFYPQNETLVCVIDAGGIVRSRRIMLRAFRPSDADIITSIYEARGDVLKDKYDRISSRFRRLKSN